MVKSGKTYNVAVSRKIIREVFAHMLEASNKPWTVEELRDEASKYQTRSELERSSSEAYQAARKKGVRYT